MTGHGALLSVALLFTACPGEDTGHGGSASATISAGSSTTTEPELPARTDVCRFYSTAFDCDHAPPFPPCQWFTRRVAAGCATVDSVDDVGCYSQATRCDAGAPIVGTEQPSLVCGAGQTCTPFETVGDLCTGGVTDQDLDCQEPCTELTYSLCLPAYEP